MMDMHAQIKKQLPELLALQDSANFEEREDWAQNNFPWYRVALSLCAYAATAFGWTEKVRSPDQIEKVKYYLVVIFSNLLSENLRACVKKGLPISDNPAAFEFLAGSYSRGFQGQTVEGFNCRLDEFMGSCATGRIPVHKFWGLCACVGLEWPELRLLFLKHIKEVRLSHVA